MRETALPARLFLLHSAPRSLDGARPRQRRQGPLAHPPTGSNANLFWKHLTRTPRNNVFPAIWASLGPAKSTHKIKFTDVSFRCPACLVIFPFDLAAAEVTRTPRVASPLSPCLSRGLEFQPGEISLPASPRVEMINSSRGADANDPFTPTLCAPGLLFAWTFLLIAVCAVTPGGDPRSLSVSVCPLSTFLSLSCRTVCVFRFR